MAQRTAPTEGAFIIEPPASNRSSLSLRPKKRGPFHLVSGDRESDFGEAVIGLAFQAKPSGITIHPL